MLILLHSATKQQIQKLSDFCSMLQMTNKFMSLLLFWS